MSPKERNVEDFEQRLNDILALISFPEIPFQRVLSTKVLTLPRRQFCKMGLIDETCNWAMGGERWGRALIPSDRLIQISFVHTTLLSCLKLSRHQTQSSSIYQPTHHISTFHFHCTSTFQSWSSPLHWYCPSHWSKPPSNRTKVLYIVKSGEMILVKSQNSRS